MNTYLIPISDPYEYDLTNYLVVYAESEIEAYEWASNSKYTYDRRIGDYELWSYEYYEGILPIQDKIFEQSQKCDIINRVLKDDIIQHDHMEDQFMATFNVNWDKYTNALAEKADKEIWSNKTYPNNGILKNYITHTYKKLKEEKNVIIKPNYGLFNTGLFTKYYDPIYAYSGDNQKIEFLTGYELSSRGIEERPPRANYFTKPELLVFDWHFPIDIQFDHILDDEKNIQRLPKGFNEKENKICILTGAIELMKKRVAANYKLAIPQYFDGKQQLLLPLCLDTDDEQPNLALAVTKLKSCYQGHTCLTLDMAYNNARLIAKPDSQWLRPTK